MSMRPVMSKFEERLCREVRKYRHLYDTTAKDYRDFQLTKNSWREIAETMSSDERTVRTQWKYIRGRFTKAKRRSNGPDGVKNFPAILNTLSWLNTYVRLRESEPNYPCEKTGKDGNASEFNKSASVPCPTALPALLPCSTSQRSPILVPSIADSAESETSDLDSDSSYILENPETVGPAKRQRRDDSQDILKKPSDISRGWDQREEEQSRAEYHFCMTMANMISPLPPKAKNETMFKIHQLVYEAQKQYLFGGPEDN